VKEVERLKAMIRVSYTMIFTAVPVPAATYRRWRFRVKNGRNPVNRTGPRPLEPLNLKKLDAELERLAHGPKRSRGISELHKEMRGSLSRRELDEMVLKTRRDTLRKERAEQSKLSWHQPGSVWGMDICEIRAPRFYRKRFALSVQDLASGYKLPPLSSDNVPKGKEVADHLGQLFKEFGRPLFLKRDNGGNLNHSSVTDLLAENHVLPLNNPCYYAPYNGAIEHAQGEFKRILRKDQNQLISLKEFTLSAELAAHDLNHVRRRRRQGATSCGLFYNSPRFSYSNRKRKEVFLWICERAVDIMQQAGKRIAQSSAWRIACKIWLVKNDLLSISKYNEVLPPFTRKTAHH